MNILAKLSWRQLLLNKRRTLVTIIGVVLSVALITAVSTFVVSFQDLLIQDTTRSWGDWHACFTAIEIEKIEIFNESPEVAQVMLAKPLGYAYLEGCINEYKPYLFIQELDEGCLASLGLELKEGRFPQQAGEVVVSNHISYNGGVEISIGQELVLDIGERLGAAGEILNQGVPFQKAKENREGETLRVRYKQRFTVVGIVERPSIEPHSAPGYSVFTAMDEEIDSGFLDVWIKYKKLDKEDKIFSRSQALAALAGVTPIESSNQEEIYYPVLHNNNLFQVMGVSSFGLYDSILNWFIFITIGIIMIGSISLIYNAFAISIAERSKQLGMLASVGATANQKRGTVLYESLAIGLLGIPLGLVVGIVGMGTTFHFINPVLANLFRSSARLRLVVSPVSLGGAVFLSAVTILISAWLPARRAAKVTPISAIRQTQDIKLTGKRVRTSKLTKLLFGFEASLALKNLKRNRKRYRNTVFSLTVSLVLFLTVSSYLAYADLAMDLTLQGNNFDIVIYCEELTSENLATLARIGNLQQVEKHTFSREYSGKAQISEEQVGKLLRQNREAEDGQYRFSVYLKSLDDDSFASLAKASGIKFDFSGEKAGAVALNLVQGLKEQMFPLEEAGLRRSEGIKRVEGQVFQTLPSTLNVDLAGSVEEITLAGMVDEPALGSSPWNDPQDLILYLPEQVFANLLAKTGAVQPGGSLYLVASELDVLEKTARTMLPADSQDWFLANPGSVQTTRQGKQIKSILTVFVLGFILLITGICIANIINTISTSVALRRREFAMLKSVGMTPGGFNRMIRYESVFYGIKSLSYGLPISLALHILLYRATSSGFEFTYVLPWKSYVLAVMVVLVVVFSTMMYSSGRIKRENIIDALKEENL